MNLVAYLDEAGREPEEAAKFLASKGIREVVLRRAWSFKMTELGDDALKQLKECLIAHGLAPICLHTTLGDIPLADLSHLRQGEIADIFNLAEFLRVKYVRVGVGEKGKDILAVNTWAARVTEQSIGANVIPLFEPHPDAAITSPADIVLFFKVNPRWRLLYDPGLLVSRHLLDPFTRYWPLIKHYAAMVDIHDFKRGFPTFAGAGEAKLLETLQDIAISDLRVRLVLEPGMKQSQIQAKQEALELAINLVNSVPQLVTNGRSQPHNPKHQGSRTGQLAGGPNAGTKQHFRPLPNRNQGR